MVVRSEEDEDLQRDAADLGVSVHELAKFLRSGHCERVVKLPLMVVQQVRKLEKRQRFYKQGRALVYVMILGLKQLEHAAKKPSDTQQKKEIDDFVEQLAVRHALADLRDASLIDRSLIKRHWFPDVVREYLDVPGAEDLLERALEAK